MFRQEDNRKLYPDIDLSPLPPNRNMSAASRPRPIRRSYSSGMSLGTASLGMTLADTASIQPLADCLPVQPTRRTTMAHNNKKKATGFRRSFSSGMALEDLSTLTPLDVKSKQNARWDANSMRVLAHPSVPPKTEEQDNKAPVSNLRRQNSANSLRCLTRSAVPKRPSLMEQQQAEEEEKQARRSRRRSQESQGTRRRHKSVDDFRSRMGPAEDLHQDNIPQGRRVIRSSRDEAVPSSRRGRSREPNLTKREQGGIPGSIKIVRGHSCGGRIPSSVAVVTAISRQSSAKDLSEDEDQHSYSTTSEDDSSSCSSVDDEFDEASLGGIVFNGTGHVKTKEPSDQTYVSSLSMSTDLKWKSSDGSVLSTASPENREALQRSLNDAMSALSNPSKGSANSLQLQEEAVMPLQQQQQQLQEQDQMYQDDSKRTDPTARMSQDDCGSVVSGISYGMSHYQPQPNVVGHLVHHGGGQMMRPWICSCGEDNEADFNFCGMCAAPQKWTCGACNFTRNKNRSPHCGSCGLHRVEAPATTGMVGDHSSRSQRSVQINGGNNNPMMPMPNQALMGDHSSRSQRSYHPMPPVQGQQQVPMGNSSTRSQRSAYHYGNPMIPGQAPHYGHHPMMQQQQQQPMNNYGHPMILEQAPHYGNHIMTDNSMRSQRSYHYNGNNPNTMIPVQQQQQQQ